MTDQPAASTESIKPIGISQEAKEVQNLPNRDIKWRARYKETVSELETVKAKTESEIKLANEKAQMILKEKSQIESKWIDAEIKAEAISAGLTDLDLVQLIDKSQLKIDEHGKIIGLKEVIADFKSKKPAFFGEAKKSASSTNAPLPKQGAVSAISAWDISKSDYQKNRSRYMNGRFY